MNSGRAGARSAGPRHPSEAGMGFPPSHYIAKDRVGRERVR